MVTKLRKLRKAIQEIFGTRQNDFGAITSAATGIITNIVMVQSGDIGVLIGQMMKMGLQFKIMMAGLDLMGIKLATEVDI
jgi:hypothetical protein